MPRIQNIHQPAEIKNHIINGAFDFWQERVSTVTTVNTATSTAAWIADMWKYESGGATTKNYSIQRSTDIPTQAQAGFQAAYSALWTQITQISSLASGDYLIPFEYQMEGLDYARLHSKTVTFGFWFKSSIVGTYSFTLSRQGFDRTYVTTFPVNVANTWEFKSITITLDTISGWFFDNTVGLRIFVGAISGSNFTAPSTNAWNSTGSLMASGSTNWAATAGATLRMAMFSMTEGSLGLGTVGFQRAGKNMQQELAMCQRYYEKTYNVETAPDSVTLAGARAEDVAGQLGAGGQFEVRKRTTPTFTFYNPDVGGSNTVRYRNTIGAGASGAVNAAVTNLTISETAYNFDGASQDNFIALWHYVADARL